VLLMKFYFNTLSSRLALWFLLISIFPIMILIFFIQPGISSVMYQVHQQMLQEKINYAILNLSVDKPALLDTNLLSDLFGNNTDFFILDENQNYLTHRQEDKIGKNLEADYSSEDIANILEQNGNCHALQQDKTILCSEQIPSTPYILVIKEDITAYLDQINAANRKSIIQLGFSLLIMVLATGFIIWLLVAKPIHLLIEATERIGRGDFSGDISTDAMNDELEVLGNTFNAMSTYIASLLQNQKDKISELDQMSTSLEKSQENLRTFFLSVNDFIFVINQKEEIIYTNRIAENLLGYKQEEIIGANIFTIFIRNFASNNVKALFSQSVGVDTTDGYLLCKDGSFIEIEMKLSKGLWNDQWVTFGLARNVSERIQSQKEIQKQIQRLESLHRIDQTITGTLDLNITMNVLLSQLNQQLNIQGSTVLLYDAITHQLDFFAEQGFNFSGIFKHGIRVGDGFAGKAAINRQVLVSEEVDFPPGDTSLPPFLSGRHFETVYDVPLIAKGELKGVLELYSNAPALEDTSWNSFLGALATQAALAIDNTTLFNDLQKTNTELFLAYDITLEGWVKTLELRDLESHQHSVRIMDMTMSLIKLFNFRDSSLSHIRRGALLHDIGKLGIPDQILNKPGPLTEKEWLIVKQHPIIAYDLLSKIPFLKPALNIPYSHHERWDGTGYPQGLAGDHIPLEARIFAVIDVWDALIHDCVYRKAWKKADALSFIEENAGTQFDPEVVNIFLSYIAQNPG